VRAGGRGSRSGDQRSLCGGGDEKNYRETIPEMEYIHIVSVIEEIVSLFHDVSIAFERSKG
jgi:hypothetical protein